MLSGKRFLLKASILGIRTVGESREAVRVPEGEIIEVVSGPRADVHDTRYVDLLWKGQLLMVFAEDFQNRAEEIH